MSIWVDDRIAVYGLFPGDFRVYLLPVLGDVVAVNAVFGIEKGDFTAFPVVGPICYLV